VSGRGLDWLVSRPIAHRGLHDKGAGVIENSLSAARAAVAAGYAIECDLQLSADGEAVVFHDDDLHRLTGAAGRVGDRTARELSGLMLKGAKEGVPLFKDLLEEIQGRVPLVVELKTEFDGDLALPRRAAELLAGYTGPVAVESFDPDPIAFLREQRVSLDIEGVSLGLVAQATYAESDWPELSAARRQELTQWLHFSRSRPEFLSFNVEDLPHVAAVLFREGLNLPVTAWTVRGADQAEATGKWIDQIVFEGFRPGIPSGSN
jgi:glycerophosphoryl diester phosphodiesterase